MFFSLIIPTYNPRKYLSILLDSVMKNECINDIEVIISDDCSEESFDDILDKYDKLNIVRIKNEKHAGFPRNGRQHGAEIATGKWLCFADQDDYFLDNAFDKAKYDIEEYNVTDYCFSDFFTSDMNDNLTIQRGDFGWTHGKFIEKAFWDKYELSYGNVDYCEDINLTTRVKCILLSEQRKGYKISGPLYVWKRWHNTLSNDKYFVDSMTDYVKSSFCIALEFLEKFKDNPEKKEIFNRACIEEIFHLYFNFQCDLFIYDRISMLNTILFIIPVFRKYKEIMGYTTDTFIQTVMNNFLDLYTEMRTYDWNQIPFSEQLLFAQWIYAYLGE